MLNNGIRLHEAIALLCESGIMATPWPQDEIWPTDYREHATNLIALIGALTLIVKIQSRPDLGHVYKAVKNGQIEIKAAAKNLA
ncbi:Uncharacterized protein HZ326_14424 [Fusarium oxysporum f. sp. albedinis]|nr:Uncharacterized protein HZ326_14424 [Fusarium oxysporum f. sp. albedinis]